MNILPVGSYYNIKPAKSKQSTKQEKCSNQESLATIKERSENFAERLKKIIYS